MTIEKLIHDAALASEVFGDDELERYAEEEYKGETNE